MILDQLADAARRRVAREKEIVSLEKLKQQAFALAGQEKQEERPLEKILKCPGIHLICEVKRASPSKGILAEQFPYLEIAKEYEKGGADCISVLTEPEYFLGSDEYFREIRKQVEIPMLRKDFTIDEYQIYQAKEMGADCILLICALLSEEVLCSYLRLCDTLHLSALVETHKEEEVKLALSAGARILGVNNRDLKTFEVDLETSRRLREMVPKDIVFVAESGIQSKQEIQMLTELGVNGVLIGEMLMRCKDKRFAIQELKA